jgi:phosphate transport system substrate-binding protein
MILQLRVTRGTALGFLFAISASLANGCRREDSSASNDAAAGETRRIVATGSSTIAPLVAEIGKRFEALRGDVRVEIQTGGSSRGILDVREGTADLGLVSRTLLASEEKLIANPIAHDGVAMIVHASNPIRDLDDASIIEIFTGRLSNWRDVGGNDAPITVVNKADGRATLEVFLGRFGLKSPEIRADVVIGDNAQGIKTVAGNPNAIGYVSIGSAEHDAAHGTPIRLLPLGGVAASTANVAAGTYSMSRPLYLVTREEPTGLLREFVEFAQSERVHDLIRAQYFVPTSLVSTSSVPTRSVPKSDVPASP